MYSKVNGISMMVPRFTSVSKNFNIYKCFCANAIPADANKYIVNRTSDSNKEPKKTEIAQVTLDNVIKSLDDVVPVTNNINHNNDNIPPKNMMSKLLKNINDVTNKIKTCSPFTIKTIDTTNMTSTINESQIKQSSVSIWNKETYDKYKNVWQHSINTFGKSCENYYNETKNTIVANTSFVPNLLNNVKGTLRIYKYGFIVLMAMLAGLFVYKQMGSNKQHEIIIKVVGEQKE